MNAGVDETRSDPAGTARKWSASSKASHLWIFPVVLVRILEWIFKEPCFLKLVWEARKAELAAEARLVWLWHVEIIRHCGDANISEACEYRWMEWILSPYNTSAVLVRVQRRICMQIQGLHARGQTATNGTASQCREKKCYEEKWSIFKTLRLGEKKMNNMSATVLLRFSETWRWLFLAEQGLVGRKDDFLHPFVLLEFAMCVRKHMFI